MIFLLLGTEGTMSILYKNARVQLTIMEGKHYIELITLNLITCDASHVLYVCIIQKRVLFI